MTERTTPPEPYGFDVQQRPGFWTRTLQVLGVLVVIALLFGAIEGATYTPESSATGTSFFGHSAVVAQLAAADDIHNCGRQSGDIASFQAVTPPFTASNVIPGPAMRAPGAVATGLVSCLTKLYEHLGLNVSKCPEEATSVGISAGRLRAYIIAAVMCRVTNGGS